MRVLLTACLFAFTFSPAHATIPAKSKVARHGNFEVKQVVVPGFENLSLDRKLYVYHLSEALEAGRDIAWLQLSKNGLAVRQMFERTWPRFGELDPATREALEEYYFKLLFNHSFYDQNTNVKFVVEGLTPARFAEIMTGFGEPAGQVASYLPDLFNTAHLPFRVAPAGQDKLLNSGSNFYAPELTEARLRELSEEEQRDFLSYPYIDTDGTVRLQRLKIGGRFDEQLRKLRHFLSKARLFATLQEQEILAAHIRVLETGDTKDLDHAERLWVQYHPEDIGLVFGFTETYDDPLEARGTWEGFLVLKNREEAAVKRNQNIGANVQLFESLMPVRPEYKKTAGFVAPNSEGAFLIKATGGHDEKGFRGVNLPNSANIREELGSQSYTLYNKVSDIGAAGEEYDEDSLREFYLPEYHEILKRFGRSLPYTMSVEFHEILGHGSGRELVDSQKALGENYSAMEESRAEVAAMYTFSDPKLLLELGILPDGFSLQDAEQFAQVAILEFFSNQIQSYHKLNGQTEIRQAHQLGRQIILNQALANGAVRVELSATGVPQVRLSSLSHLRSSLALTWFELQEIKSTGDAKGLEKLLKRWGRMTEEQRRWAKHVGEAVQRVNEANEVIYLNPLIQLVTEPGGEPKDVKLSYEQGSKDWRVVFEREQARVAADHHRDCGLALTSSFF